MWNIVDYSLALWKLDTASLQLNLYLRVSDQVDMVIYFQSFVN